MAVRADARLIAVSCVVLLAAPARAQQTPTDYVASIVPNVVRVEAGGRTGFGFIVGMDGLRFLVATALHTLDAPGGDRPTLCFADPDGTCATGEVVHVADAIGSLPALDLALVRVPYLGGLLWRPDVLAGAARSGEDVWYIGRSRDWYIPERPGRVTGIDAPRRLVRYTGLAVAEGVSGAPIVGARGILAMHVESAGDVSHGVAIDEIRRRVEERVRGTWILVPRRSCTELQAHRSALEGRSIAVHFDPARIEPALDAMARLLCVGARPLPRPVRDATTWPGERITYASGELRAARAIQAVLAPLGRLDAVLGSAPAEFELWIR